MLAVDEVADAAEVDPEFDVDAEFEVDAPPSDEEAAAAAGFSEPPLDSVEFDADFELPLPA